MAGYTHIFCRLLFFLLHHHDCPVKGYEIPLTESQVDLITRLWRGLRREAPVRKHFHALAMSILLVPRSPDLTDRYRFPLMRFICMVHLRQDGGGVPPQQLTWTFAALQWTFRAVMCMEICSHRVKGEGSSKRSWGQIELTHGFTNNGDL